MKKIRERRVQRDSHSHRKNQIKRIKARIAELDKYKIELEKFYNKLQLELDEKDS